MHAAICKPAPALAALLLAATASSTLAAPACTVDALNALHVPNVSVTQATPTPASGTTPAHCAVQASVVTHGEGAPDGSARAAIQLPDTWQQRFFSMGVGGNAGILTPAVNATDRAAALGKGYVVIVTDTGHTGNGTDANWVVTADGKRDTAKITDFFYRAEHDVTLAGKQFAQAYYGAPVQHAYRRVLDRRPHGDDGSGALSRRLRRHHRRHDPNLDYNSTMLRFLVQKVALSSPAAYLPQSLLAAIDKRVTARCDAIDGATDGLVQNPARCPIHAEDLVCKSGDTGDCLTPEQAGVLHAYTTGLRDRHGHVLYPGYAITNLSGPRGISYWTTGDTAPNLAQPESPWGSDPAAPPRGWEFARRALTYWLGLGPDAKMATVDVDVRTGSASDKLVATLEHVFGPAETKNPAKLLPFIQQGRKLIIYHGTSDPAIPAARSIMFYHELTELLHGADKTAASVQVCSWCLACSIASGGIGPGPVRYTVGDRGLGGTRQGAGGDRRDHQAGQPRAAQPAAVPVSAAGALFRQRSADWMWRTGKCAAPGRARRRGPRARGRGGTAAPLTAD